MLYAGQWDYYLETKTAPHLGSSNFLANYLRAAASFHNNKEPVQWRKRRIIFLETKMLVACYVNQCFRIILYFFKFIT